MMSMSHQDFKMSKTTTGFASHLNNKESESSSAAKLKNLFKKKIEQRHWDLNSIDKKQHDR